MTQPASVVECDPPQCGAIALDLPVCCSRLPSQGKYAEAESLHMTMHEALRNPWGGIIRKCQESQQPNGVVEKFFLRNILNKVAASTCFEIFPSLSGQVRRRGRSLRASPTRSGCNRRHRTSQLCFSAQQPSGVVGDPGESHEICSAISHCGHC